MAGLWPAGLSKGAAPKMRYPHSPCLSSGQSGQGAWCERTDRLPRACVQGLRTWMKIGSLSIVAWMLPSAPMRLIKHQNRGSVACPGVECHGRKSKWCKTGPVRRYLMHDTARGAIPSCTKYPPFNPSRAPLQKGTSGSGAVHPSANGPFEGGL